jgi:glutaredoxin
MGRITVFALQECPHCKRGKAYLTERGIPYVEISLSSHPDKRTDMLSLADRLTVPQFFFNEAHIGGADELIGFVDNVENKNRNKNKNNYATAFEYYEKEIKDKPDPTDARLQVPTTPPVIEKPPPPRDNEKSVPMSDGTKATALDVTLKLKKRLPCQNLKYNITIYKNTVSGTDATAAFKDIFGLKTDSEAIEFGNMLIQSKIMNHVTGNHAFKNENLYYRLQCYETPDVLNSFRIWTERVDPDNMSLLKRLKKLLGKVESAVTDNQGLVDYKNAHKNENWSLFEEAVCELQGVDMGLMKRDMRLAFGINLYNLMIKYAFMKVGIGNSNAARGAFFSGVKMNIGGDILSFNDLEHGVLRGNKKPVFGFSNQLSASDPRARLALPNPDCRVHFSLNCGAKSCPPVKNFSTAAIEEELRIVAQAFCEQEDNVRIDENNNAIYLTKIFSWFRVDFAPSNKELPTKTATFLRGENKAKLEKMITSGKSLAVNFNAYDWGTNASAFVPFESSFLNANVTGIRALF